MVPTNKSPGPVEIPEAASQRVAEFRTRIGGSAGGGEFTEDDGMDGGVNLLYVPWLNSVIV